MNGIYIIIGGNLNNRLENLKTCRLALSSTIGKIINTSSIYETASWGKENVPDYLNQVIFMQSDQSAFDVLHHCLQIEKDMGRIRHEKWASRIIDIDILFFNKECIHCPGLEIPHPQIANRKFVLIPLNEIAPDFVHPILLKPVNILLNECDDKLDVTLYKHS